MSRDLLNFRLQKPRRPRIRPRSGAAGDRLRALAGAAALALLCLGAAGGGCGDDEHPFVPIDHPVEFDPPESNILLPSREYVDFKALDRTNPNYEVAWLRDGRWVGQGPRYRFYPVGYDLDTLTARVEYPDQILHRTWYVAVDYPTPIVEFRPDADSLAVIETTGRTLYASSNRSRIARHSWTVDGQPVGADTCYTFAGTTPGTRTVACRVEIEDEVFAREWSIRTIPLAEAEMPAVVNVQFHYGDLPGEIHGYWEALEGWVRAVQEYLVLVSYEGPITPENQQAAQELLVVPAEAGRVDYLETFFDYEYEQLIAGDEAWFSVVAVDVGGRVGPAAESTVILLPSYWYLEGTVSDYRGEPLSGARILDTAATYDVTTGADGAYRIGPYPSTREVQLIAEREAAGDEPAYGRCRTPGLTIDCDPGWDFRLVPAWETDPDCDIYDQDFMLYFRSMTTTLRTRTDRPDLRLLRWQEYPLSVYVPPFVSAQGVDFRAVTTASIGIWNLLLSEPCFELVETADEADVVFVFGVPADGRFGLTSVLQPGDGQAFVGSVIPEKMSVTLYDNILTVEKAEATSLHELGHVLGFCSHASCNVSGYLMYVGPILVRDDWPYHAIHPDELHVVETVRYLPQGTDMSVYLVD